MPEVISPLSIQSKLLIYSITSAIHDTNNDLGVASLLGSAEFSDVMDTLSKWIYLHSIHHNLIGKYRTLLPDCYVEPITENMLRHTLAEIINLIDKAIDSSTLKISNDVHRSLSMIKSTTLGPALHPKNERDYIDYNHMLLQLVEAYNLDFRPNYHYHNGILSNPFLHPDITTPKYAVLMNLENTLIARVNPKTQSVFDRMPNTYINDANYLLSLVLDYLHRVDMIKLNYALDDQLATSAIQQYLHDAYVLYATVSTIIMTTNNMDIVRKLDRILKTDIDEK